MLSLSDQGSTGKHSARKRPPKSTKSFSKGVAEVSSQSISNLDITYLNAIGSGSHASWKATINLRDQIMTFKLDTGAEATALTEPAFLQFGDVPLQAPTTPSMAQTSNP